MKRKAQDDGPPGPQKRQVVESWQLQDADDEPADSYGGDETSITSTDPLNSIPALVQTAATSVTATSATSRARPKYPSDLKTIQCAYCSKTFNRPARLTAHLRSHTNDRPFKCTFADCDKQYLEEKHLKQHIKGSHTEERKYVCDEPGCGKSFLTGTRLRRHAAVHEGAARFRCQGHEGCSQSFRKHSTLQRHIRIIHLHLPAYVCGNDGCEKGFDSAGALRRHVEREHGELRFWCDECVQDGEDGDEEVRRLGFTTLALLQAHMRVKHRNCPFCDVKCAGQWELDQHVDMHHTGKTVEERKVYPCTWAGCDKKFVRASNMQVHIRTAHEGQRFVCGQVDTFGVDDITDWNWEEEGCGEAFISKMKLEEHVRHVHLGRKRPLTSYPLPPAPRSIIDELSGLTESSKLTAVCLVAGCNARFVRSHELALHLQEEHYGEQDMEALVADAPPRLARQQPGPSVHPLRHVESIEDTIYFTGVEDPTGLQRENSFDNDWADMRRLVDFDALAGEALAGHGGGQ